MISCQRGLAELFEAKCPENNPAEVSYKFIKFVFTYIK